MFVGVFIVIFLIGVVCILVVGQVFGGGLLLVFVLILVQVQVIGYV